MYVAVAAGGEHACALDEDGRAWCWGSNSDGQIGVGKRHEVLASPVAVNGTTRFRTLALGARHSCGITLEGRAWCWGANDDGQLGDGTESDRDAPRPVIDLGDVIAIAAGATHSCALDETGAAWCWGENGAWQLGTDRVGASLLAVRVATVAGASQLAAGGAHACAVTGTGGVCWGANASGQLGSGTVSPRTLPVAASGDPALRAITLGRKHGCALLADGRAACWGANEAGQLGRSGAGSAIPQAVPLVASDFVALVSGAGADATCGALPTSVWCWGNGAPPAAVSGLPTGIVSGIAVGARHACAVVAGRVLCWGEGERGQLGDGSRRSSQLPVALGSS